MVYQSHAGARDKGQENRSSAHTCLTSSLAVLCRTLTRAISMIPRGHGQFVPYPKSTGYRYRSYSTIELRTKTPCKRSFVTQMNKGLRFWCFPSADLRCVYFRVATPAQSN